MNRARANSWSVVAPRTSEPMISSERIGRSAVIEVFKVRMSTSFNESLTMRV
jgi:hypothetical protein